MAFTLPTLKYDYAALEPHIDTQTMEIHHTKHHQTYVNNLNAALQDYPDLQNKSIEALLADVEALPQAIRTAVQNNGGGHANHSLFWEIMTPGGASEEPEGDLAQAITNNFENLANFKETLTQAAITRFGSGWGWLVVDNGELQVYSTANQDSPLMQGHTPILGIDVWEHAYYLHYQNRRPDYISSWWNLVNWDVVAQKFAAA